MTSLHRKVALVTGAGRGIGAAVATAFAREGARVWVTDIDLAGAAATAQAIGARSARLDVREELGWVAMMAQLIDVEGRLDVLVNNAAITGLEDGGVHNPEHASLAHWQAVHRTNLDGVFLGCKHAIGAMRRHPRRPASIINLSPRFGVVDRPGAAAYASSRAAVRHHSRRVALYCAGQGLPIRCHAIHSVAPKTPVCNLIHDAGPDREASMAARVAYDPLTPFCTPEEVAAVALLLASDGSA